MIDNAVSLFSGIGGFDLALARAGVYNVAAAEIDASCRVILLNKIGPGAIFGDVREVTGDFLINYAMFEPETGIITAGWPCQGNSQAGRRAGMEDPRSGLWWEVYRVLEETRPQWFLGENVPGLLTVNSGQDFHKIILSLVDGLGYGVAWRVLDAKYFGVPQKRRRLFIAGCLGDGVSAAEVLFDAEGGEGHIAESGEARPEDPEATIVSTLQGGGKRGYRIDAEGAAGNQLVVARTLTSGATASKANPPGRRGEDDYNLVPVGTFGLVGVRRLTPLECERLQGFPDNWTAGQSDSARYRQLGNAVAVPMVQWIVDRMVSISNADT